MIDSFINKSSEGILFKAMGIMAEKEINIFFVEGHDDKDLALD